MLIKICRYVCGSLLLVVGIVTIAHSGALSGMFRFLSPDGIIHPSTLLELRLLLASLAPVGLVLVFYPHLLRVLAVLDRVFKAMPMQRFLLGIFSTGLLLRVAVVLFIPLRLYIDYGAYDELAWTWAEQGGYYNGNYYTGYWPPGYPFFLSRLYWLFGHHPVAGAIANVILSLAIAWLSYVLTRRVFGERIARWALVLMMFFPSQILFVNLLTSEMVFTPLFLASLWLFLVFERRFRGRWVYCVAGGILLGLATLTRALTQVYWILLAPLWYFQTDRASRALRNLVLAVIGMLLVLTPWIYRNYERVGRARISTNGGINLYIGNHPGAGMGWNNDGADEYDTNDATLEKHIDRVAGRRGFEYILAHPVAFVKRGVFKVAYFYAVDLTGVHYELIQAAENERTDGYVILSWVQQCYYLLVLLAGAMGLLFVYFRRREYRSAGGYLMWVTILFWTAVHFVFFGHGRFHFPIMPMFCAFAALFIVDRLSRKAL